MSAARKAETDAVMQYSAVIGNDYHLDLLDAEQVVNQLPREERARLLLWCDGLTSSEAAQFASVRPGALHKRNQRTLNKVRDELNDQGADTRRDG